MDDYLNALDKYYEVRTEYREKRKRIDWERGGYYMEEQLRDARWGLENALNALIDSRIESFLALGGQDDDD